MLENSLLGSITDHLLTPRKKRSFCSVLVGRYWRTSKCIGSKAVITILVSSFTVSLILFELLLNSDNHYFHSKTDRNGSYNSSVVFVILLDLIGVFYPIAGYLADNKFGRYKTVRFSLIFLLLPSALLGTIYIILMFVLPSINVVSVGNLYYSVIYWCVAGVIDVVVCVGVVGFFANIIQFGMDQVYDYPAEVQSLFIHWFWWVSFAAQFVTQLLWYMSQLPCEDSEFTSNATYCMLSFIGRLTTAAVYIVLFILLLVISCLVITKKNWFLIEPSSVNPYKLVYKVTRFAFKYRKPLSRSAFTYCEDEIPSGLDIGKMKYGGPFTMEQVEDVKAFYGIFLVLITLGPVFSLRVGADGTLYQFAQHKSVVNFTTDSLTWNVTSYNDDAIKMLLVNYGALTPLLMTLLVPLHLIIIRPLFFNYIPGMLKRIGLGIITIIISVVCTGTEQLISHKHYTTGCIFDGSIVTVSTSHNETSEPLLDTNILIVQRTLSALSIMLINIATYEFICSQSPHSMKGLLIGLAYAIKALFQTLSSALMVPLTLLSSTWCGEIWYFTNFVMGLGALIFFSVVAKKYRYRMRNDTCHVYKFAEEYYSKVQ